ncbi:type I restriction-modification system subunit M [Undibacterium umbellatum]|uniref:site-specific DNA-methyltransferase (adenine-specific) n=1 Tax=Undibacterium umbellatum TaxID=2762300 RepID=A0ABR6ZA72_9BURK|nr:type I restriction-modification system subunit M [Undibacterium umbellatum]MBC3908230.1 N-6 DNA methylase [Undibacterium umbellatum]
MNNTEIVQKLWNLCDILRDDGINYSDYVSELVLLLFIKMEQEVQEHRVILNPLARHKLPEYARWETLAQLPEEKRLDHYKKTLKKLSESEDQLINAIYANAQSQLKEPRHLSQLIKSLNSIGWFSEKKDGLGDLYEGLLEKNVIETKSGAGQYFTTRPLIDSIIAVVKPKAGEIIQDPAAGTAGFLISANAYIRSQTNDFFGFPPQQIEFQRSKAYVGVELVASTRRLALMNCLLHDMEGDDEGIVILGNTLSDLGRNLPPADLILSNPPFGTAKGGGGPTRKDLPFTTGNKQLAFLQHIYLGLKPGGRAAVVLPDNALFETGIGSEIRKDLMNKCHLHTVLRLPTGIFYAQGVKTNVVFFTKVSDTAVGSTDEVWVYDLRANMPKFGKRTPFSRKYFREFEIAYGDDPYGKSTRINQGEQGRFRLFKHSLIANNDYSLNISWLKDENTEDAADLPDPAMLTQEIVVELEAAIVELQTILDELGKA